MKVLVMGSGRMGKAAAYDLVKQDSVEQIILADIDLKAAEALAKEVGPKAVAEKVDAKKRANLVKSFSKVLIKTFLSKPII